MSSEVVKFAFIAGEISPTLFGRSDLTKYDLGMAEAHNFFVDYRGGLSSRPGFQFIDFVKTDDKPTRFAEFAFSPDIEDTYIVLFGDLYIRFLQDGGYVLQTDIAITGLASGVAASVGHGLAVGRWVKYNGRTYRLSAVTANTFTLVTVPDNGAVTLTAGAGVVSPVYEIVSPYPAADLDALSFDQYRDTLRVTSAAYAPRELIRSDHTSWAISETVVSEYTEGPTITSSTASAAGNAQTIFAVTSLYVDGSESSIGNLFLVANVVNYPTTEGSISINWTRDLDAVEYKVYRSIVSVSQTLSFGSELGYAGRTQGTKFTDPNIIPDFGQTPQINRNPFAPGAIISIRVTAGGAGYSEASVVTMGGGGTGFDAQVIVDGTGAIVNILIKNGGQGYTAPTAAISGGAGATTVVTARALIGTYPALSVIFQQRQVYAASDNQPITIWGSQYRRFSNFASSAFTIDSDSFEFDLDTAAIAPIRHLLVTRGGMLAMTQKNVWIVNGGKEGEALTPSNALAEPQTYTGVSALRPLQINSDVLYTEGKGYAVRMLSYSDQSRVYGGEDKSILSNHLFGPGKEVVRWGYQENPFKTVWSVRSDGALLAFTIVRAEDVFAWTPGSTKGRFLDLIVVQEISEDRVYVTTQRFVNGRWTKMIERMDLRLFENVEDAWCVDAGLSLTGTFPVAALVIYRSEAGVYSATASAAIFTGTEGRIIRGANGIFSITSVVSPYTVNLTARVAPDNFVPQSDDRYTFEIPSGAWTLDAATTTLSGLYHLEGESVSILGDGNVMPKQTVVNGAVQLPVAVTRAIVGLAYACRAKTLPMIVPDAGIEAKRKRIVGLAVRLTKSRGLKYGDAYDRTYEMKERTDENWGEPTRLQEGIRYQNIGTVWDEDGFTYFRLDDPLPVTLLSIVSDIEVGDDGD